MFNGALKREAIATLKSIQGEYESEAIAIGQASEQLFELRQTSSQKIFTQVEGYINSLANSPKSFDKTFDEYRTSYSTFNEVICAIEADAELVNAQLGGGATAGVLAGAGVATLAPTAAMAVATTFGTAGTGTAISALYGAAATNAALAWIGGGTLAAGGGGMAAGNAFLALAGPAGWAIAGTTMLTAGLYARGKNKKIAEQATSEAKRIQSLISEIVAAKAKTFSLIDLTKRHIDGVKTLLRNLRKHAPINYLDFSTDQKDILAALINHVYSLSILLNKRIEL
ncbi:MAG: hypothetical protein RIG26_04310 [Thalassospira sp.]|uniref:hypothetical protein n=1 Tax=Thalassospira sp. TaxID=1912094 RepID=UPI0032EB164F